MSYYGQGDYYAAGGIGSFLKGAARAAIGGAVGLVTGGPIAAARNVVSSIAPAARPPAAGPAFQIPQINVNPMAALPGGQPLFTFGGRKRRRMNFTNQRALNRANRRVDGFVRIVRRSLKHTPYTLTRRGSGRKKSGVTVVEKGPGSVNVRG